ncbi:MAG: hypothetical protein JWO26_2957 [Rhodospirillales bacterium]|nr:hypothetical protein [Rhodospirillales bacterium]
MANLSALRSDFDRVPSSGSLRVTKAPPLSLETLDCLPSAVRRPGFDVAALRPGILHLGCGAFHRAHQAVFTQRAIEAETSGAAGAAPPAWGIVASSLRQPSTRNALRPQDGLYTVLERGPDATRAEVVGSLREVGFAPEDPAALLARFADPAIRIVTLTVTSSAYSLDPAADRPCPDHSEIQSDHQGPAACSALGVLVGGLAAAQKAGTRPPVVMACDNLPENGRTLQQAAMDYASLTDDRLANWIGRSVQFPSSMVDRITPAVSDLDVADAAMMLGLADAAPVAAEPFRQWVIEDFEGARPRWDAAGAEFVTDVAPWEASKLRLLNGTHMAIAYLGALVGLRTVFEVVAEPLFADYALRFMLEEQKPTLPPSRHDIDAYAHQLLQRWRNPGIVHDLGRVGRNGSDKLQPRLLASLMDNLQAGRPAPCTILAVAAWICCVTGLGVPAEAVEIEDPLSENLRSLGRAAGSDAARLTASVLEMENLFGQDLPRMQGFRAELTAAVSQLQRVGPRRAIAALMASAPAAPVLEFA